jgi:CheY-like chemotaxis protein
VRHILIIEDNAMASALYRATLLKEGYAVEVASDGAAGLAAIARVRPDLVLLDLMLPKVNGAEVLRQIRAIPELAALPVIVTSNAYTPERLEALKRAGATRIMIKSSLSPKELTHVVRQAFALLEPAR